MNSRRFSTQDKKFTDHPKFAGVKIAVFVTKKETPAVSVSQLIIAPAVTIPVHTHDPQADSIYIIAGKGEAYVNGKWLPVSQEDYLFFPAGVEHGTRNTGSEPLVLFVHHSPPLL